MRTERGFTIVAVDRRGWSRLTAIPKGTDDATATLQLGAPARASGRVLRDGEPVEGQVRVMIDDGKARLQAFTKCDESGTWSLPPMPPGKYKVTARLPGSPSADSPQFDLTRGGEVVQDVELPIGGTVEVVAALDSVTDRFVVAELVPGRHEVPDFAALSELKSRYADDKQHLFRINPQRNDPLVFEDVPFGALTACVVTYPTTGVEASAMACATGSLTADHLTLEMPKLQPTASD